MKTKKKTPSKVNSKVQTIGSTEGVRRTTGVDPIARESERPDPEVPEKKPRRKHTAKFKLSILEKAEKCNEPGQLGALLRQYGLYSSNLTLWRKQRDQGLLNAMSPKKRGRKPKEKNPLANQVAKLQKENIRLQKKLKQAETIIDVQKKISEILGITQNLPKEEGFES